MITKKICPKCGSSDVVMISRGMTSAWTCRNCGFTGNMVEKPITRKENGR